PGSAQAARSSCPSGPARTGGGRWRPCVLRGPRGHCLLSQGPGPGVFVETLGGRAQRRPLLCPGERTMVQCLTGTEQGRSSVMAPRYRTPRELVEALQARAREARALLQQLLRAPLERLMDQFLARHGLDEDRSLLTLHALHAAETWLRTRRPE